jgi:Holliday junction resolvasome RuvABC endonuclease subunit
MRVLAFDAATKTGWASFASARSCPVLGTIKLPKGPNHGARNLAMLRAAVALIDEHQPDVVGFEQVIFVPRDTWHERRLLTGIVGAIEIAAARAKLLTFEVKPSDAKLCLSGDRHADKLDMKRAAILMGWSVADDNQADAGAVGLVTYGHFQRG